MRILSATLLAVVCLTAPSIADDTSIPPEARALFDKAEIEREEGRHGKAVEIYRQAIDAYPLYERAHVGYQASLRALGKSGSAKDHYAQLVGDHAGSVELKAFQAATLGGEPAIAALEALEGEHGDNVRVLLELGRAHLRFGKGRDAEKALKKAVKANPESASAHVLLGDVAFQAGKFTSARKAYQAALEIDQANLPAQLRMALAWHRAGKSQEALDILQRVVAPDNFPRFVAAHWMLGLIHFEGGKTKEAIAAFDKILTIAENDYDALVAKGQILLANNQPTEAVKAFEAAVKGRRDASEALFCLGWAYEKSADAPEIQDAQRKERLQAAADAYQRCSELDPSVRPRDSLGFIYLVQGKHDDAVTQFKRATDIAPEFAPAHNNLGLSADMADNRSAAKKRYDRVLSKIDKKNVRAMVMLALDYWLDGSANKAIKELKKALKINPQDDLAWTFLGDIYYDNGKERQAISAYEEAVEVNDKNFIAWYHMGIAYHDGRKWEDADRCYRKALEAKADPPPELVLRLGEVNEEEALDRIEEALKYYQLYVDLGGTEEWVPERINELKEQLAK